MKRIAVSLLYFLSVTGLYAQRSGKDDLPERLVQTDVNSVQANEKRDVRALKSIRFESGFVSKGHLHAYVVNMETNVNGSEQGIIAYPNPSSGSITIRGTFADASLKVIDESGGQQVFEASLDGTNPTVDISQLNRQQFYILKIGTFTARLALK